MDPLTNGSKQRALIPVRRSKFHPINAITNTSFQFVSFYFFVFMLKFYRGSMRFINSYLYIYNSVYSGMKICTKSWLMAYKLNHIIYQQLWELWWVRIKKSNHHTVKRNHCDMGATNAIILGCPVNNRPIDLMACIIKCGIHSYGTC